jgi:ketosteroid isomerase-like protein
MSLASDTVKRFIRLYSDGTPETYGSDVLLEVFSPNVDWTVAPSNGHPAGIRGDREVLRKDLAERKLPPQ